jgi:hypothetical protein
MGFLEQRIVMTWTLDQRRQPSTERMSIDTKIQWPNYYF